MNKCVECGTPHKNHDENGLNDIRCFNCSIIFKMLIAFIKGVNMHKPLNGKPRKLTITGYKIEKI